MAVTLYREHIPAKKKTVYVAWTNTDCTEGRGFNYPLVVCDMRSTAERLGKRQYVQGSDCPISEETAFQIGGSNHWYAPCDIVSPTKEDERLERQRIAKEEAEQKKLEVLERAKTLGLSEEDIKILKENG